MLFRSLDTVHIWRERFDAAQSLKPEPRPGPKPTYTIELQARIIALFCQKDPLPGCSRWSLRDAQIYMMNNPDYLNGPTPSPATIGRILKAHALRPHKHKYFLQIADPNFFPKMEHIIGLYRNPPQHLFLFDQLTGLQALERVAPDAPAQPHLSARQDFEYIRHGTLSVCPVMDFHSGQIFFRTITDTKSVNITRVIAEHIQQFDSQQELHYICDNLSGHSTHHLCEQIAELAGVPLPDDITGQDDRRQWLQSTEKRIVFHFLPTHGSWLNLIEIWFGITRAKAIDGASFGSVDELEQAVEAFSETWNTFLAHPFQWNYTGKGLHGILVNRNITWIERESAQMTLKFLKVQVLLLNHLFCDYRKEVSQDLWEKLLQTLKSKTEFINDILIEDLEAQELFHDFMNLLLAGILRYIFYSQIIIIRHSKIHMVSFYTTSRVPSQTTYGSLLLEENVCLSARSAA